MSIRPPSTRGSAATLGLLALAGLGLLVLVGWWLMGQARPGSVPHGASEVVSEGFPRTIELPDGGSLRLEAPPRRIVPSASATTDLVVSMVGPERVAGLPRIAFTFSEFPGGPERWHDLPTFERYLAEPLLSLEPDLVVAYTWQDATPTALLTASGVPVLMLPEARDLAAMLDQLELVASALGTEQRAADVRSVIEARVEALAQGAPERSTWNAMFYSNQGVGGWTAAEGTTHDLMLDLAGVPNAAGLAGLTGHSTIDLEKLLSIDPDVIIVSSSKGQSATRRFLEESPAAAGLTALREDRIVELPSSVYDCASYHVVHGAEQLARGLDALLAAHGSR